MRTTPWPIAVIALGLLGTAVALTAGWDAVPAAAVVVPVVLVPLSALALSFVGLARTGAVRSYAVVTMSALTAPVVTSGAGRSVRATSTALPGSG